MSESQPYQSIWPTLLPRLARYLPASLYNRLRATLEDSGIVETDQQVIAAELLQAVRSLDPLHRVLIQYVPRYLLGLNPKPGQPHGELLEGSFIFADVTGFTALTELLARRGQGRGHEAMNGIMNNLFSTVLDPLIASGGDLLVFVGDAALVYFPKKDHGEDVLQATRAALRMERAIVPFASFETEYGLCSLTMSAGVERGIAYAGVVGDNRRMELLISGPGIYGATAAEKEAQPGQVVLGEQAQTIAASHFTLEGGLVIDNLGNALGDYEISLPTRRSGGSTVLGLTISEALEALELTLQRVERLAPFLPEDMLARLVNTERQRRLQPELRPVAVQFINLVGLEELAIRRGPELATAVFQRFFVRAQEIVNQHEGVISQVDAWSDGFILVNTFGAPRAHEGTTRYAVSAALQLARTLDQVNREFQLNPPLRQCSGITHGLIFTGEIGAKYRRESVIAGPAVNRAARLMSKAKPGQVILDSDIWEKSQAAFVGDPLPPVTLKGIEGPVVIINVREMRRGTRLQPLPRPLLDRETETAQLTSALDALQSARPGLKQIASGSAWLVSGETGLGKTSLMSHLAEMARQRGLTVLVGRCQPHSKHIPLFPWVDLLTGWLNFDEHNDAGLQRVRLAEELASLGLSATEKVLANLLALPAIDAINDSGASSQMQSPRSTPLLALLSAKTQASPPAPRSTQPSLQNLLQSRLAEPRQMEKTLWSRLEERVSGPHALIEWLKKLTEREPVVVILEDIDWIDHDSAALLKTLLNQLAGLPLLLALTRREAVMDFTGPAVSLPLTKLPDQILVEVAQRALGARTLEEVLAGWVCRRAGGNPLYAEELCQALQQAEAVLLDRERGQARWLGLEPALPLSLHGLLLARLDELPLTQQEVLKRAAVIGQSFEYAALIRLCQPQMSELEVTTALEGAIQASFITAVQATVYQFNHPLLQEAIYTTLAYSQRQRWHSQLGNWLEGQPEAEQKLELIAYHHLQGADMAKAARFGRCAGDRARQRGAYGGAAEYYARVLALSNISLEDRMKAAEGQADVLALQGNYSLARTVYAQAIGWGSLEAVSKQAILSGEVETLAQTIFTPALRPWADGAHAWLLAQEGQFKAAAELVHAALAGAEEPARPALETLEHVLHKREPPGHYDEWLGQFSQAVLVQGHC